MLNMNEFNPYVISSSQLHIANNSIPGIQFTKRVVRWYEFELITESNQGYVINIDHRIYTQKGLLMFRKPGSVVNGFSSYACLSVAFDSQYDSRLESYYQQPMFADATVDLLQSMSKKKYAFLESLPESLLLSNYAAIKSIMDQLMDHTLMRPTQNTIKSRQLLYSLLDAVSEELQSQEDETMKQTHSSYDVILSTKDWIDHHFADPISLQLLAEMIGYSKEAYCRLFKKIFNQSPIDYLIGVRILKAKKRLMVTNEPISLIAYECGFKNDTHFYTSFKQREGLSPGAYRDRHRP